MAVPRLPIACAALALSLGGCKSNPRRNTAEYEVGEPATVGTLTYHVIEAEWKSQLGEGAAPRIPEHNFLVLHLTVTNESGQDRSIPQLTIENANGERFTELESGEGLKKWMGYLRNLSPRQEQEGEVLFDVPTNTYRMRLTDTDNPENELVSYIKLPLKFAPAAPDSVLPPLQQ